MSEGVRLCWRCDAPITRECPGTSMPKESGSAGGAVVWWHVRCPQPSAFVRRTAR
ncbi:hypothetical protein ABZ366_11775 [Streptomyces sp. NPDC005904]|uniref:hypothetical protein n=1 Tax=Streptomyces sp. NPDC005904 TaxID=3154570 RepID=UPI0033D7E045